MSAQEMARQFIGICMDDVTSPLVSGNRVAGYEVGLCMQTTGAEVRANDVRDMCIGARVHDNRIGATAPSCVDHNLYGVFGIILTGTVRSNVVDNHISGQAAVGVALVDAGPTGPFASRNVVARNVIMGSETELVVDTVGERNVVTHNACATSTPAGLCE
jgi:nitrous oxidase accessory protein NosD